MAKMIDRSVTHRMISKLDDSKILVIIWLLQSDKSTMIELMKKNFSCRFCIGMATNFTLETDWGTQLRYSSRS
jgi:hypothetical protein